MPIPTEAQASSYLDSNTIATYSNGIETDIGIGTPGSGQAYGDEDPQVEEPCAMIVAELLRNRMSADNRVPAGSAPVTGVVSGNGLISGTALDTVTLQAVSYPASCLWKKSGLPLYVFGYVAWYETLYGGGEQLFVNNINTLIQAPPGHLYDGLAYFLKPGVSLAYSASSRKGNNVFRLESYGWYTY